MKKFVNTYEYSVVPENIDLNGRITVPSLCRHIINAIGQNVRAEGYGVDVMNRENMSWVLCRSAFEIDKRPELYTSLYVSVWPGPGNGLTFNRNITLRGEDGSELGRGTTEWCIIDMQSRRPVAPDTDRFIIGEEIPCKSPRRIRDFEPETTNERKVGYSECDFNGHLNNTRYVEMLYDMLPEDILLDPSPIRLDINYRKEIKRGQNVSFGLRHNNKDEYLFIAKNAEQTLCSASLQTA